MNRKKVERLHKAGIYSDKMYNEIISSTFSDSNNPDKLIGFLPNMAYTIYNLEFDPSSYSLVGLVEKTVPWLGADDDFPELFGKYGYTYCGISDGFNWFKKDTITKCALEHGHKPLEEASELEMWKMIALSYMYWHNSKNKR